MQRGIAAFCQLGGYDHSVLYTSAQLTEGRSPGINPSSRQQKKLDLVQPLVASHQNHAILLFASIPLCLAQSGDILSNLIVVVLVIERMAVFVSFHEFQQLLGWSSCLRLPTNSFFS